MPQRMLNIFFLKILKVVSILSDLSQLNCKVTYLYHEGFFLALVWLKPAFLRSEISIKAAKKQVSENITISTS